MTTKKFNSFLFLTTELAKFVGKLLTLIGVLAVGWGLMLVQHTGHLPFLG